MLRVTSTCWSFGSRIWLAALIVASATSELRIDRIVGRPDQFTSTLASNCRDAYCSSRGAIAAGHCLCQCPSSAGTLETKTMTCVSSFDDCNDFFLGNSSNNVQTVSTREGTDDFLPVLGLYLPTVNGSASSVAGSFACSYYQGAEYQETDGSWQPFTNLGVSSLPFGIRDSGQDMFLQWLSRENSDAISGKIVKVRLGCGQRGNANAFRYTRCIAIKAQGRNTVDEQDMTSSASVTTAPAPFEKTVYFIIIIAVLGMVLLIVVIICWVCCSKSRKRRQRESGEMVVFSVTRPGDMHSMANGHANDIASRPTDTTTGINGVSMNPNASERQSAQQSASRSHVRKQDYNTQDRLRFNGSLDSGVDRTPPSRGTQSGNEQSSGSDDHPPDAHSEEREHGIHDDELQRNLLYFEGTRFAHEKHNSPRELFKSHSERLTTVKASIGGISSKADGIRDRAGYTSENQEGNLGMGTNFTSAVKQFLSQRRNEDAPGAGRKAGRTNRSRSERQPGRGKYPFQDDDASDSAISVELEHFGAEGNLSDSLRSPRKFSDDHVNKEVTFNQDGTMVHLGSQPHGARHGVPQPQKPVADFANSRESDPRQYSERDLNCSGLYSTLSRPSHVSFTRPAESNRADTPVTEIDDVTEPKTASGGFAFGAMSRPPPPPPPPTKPPPSLLNLRGTDYPDGARLGDGYDSPDAGGPSAQRSGKRRLSHASRASSLYR